MMRQDGLARSEVWLKSSCRVGVLAGLLAGSGALWAQSTVPDAQVEANVLKALAGAPELANEPIQTRTVYGVVTLSGTVADEAMRRRAETLASTASGVKKVVDELTLGHALNATDEQGRAPMLQSDEGMAASAPSSPSAPGSPAALDKPNPAAGVTNPQRNDPEADAALDQQMQEQANPKTTDGQQTQQAQPNTNQYPQQQGQYSQQQTPYSPQNQYPQQGQYPQQQGQDPSQGQYSQQQGYPQQQGNPQQQGQYPQQQAQYPQQGQYPPQNGYPQPRRPLGYGQPLQQGYAGQVAGQRVVIPNGAAVDVRITERLASDHSQPGDVFNGVVINDVVAGGVVAIPRGAAIQGRVVSATKSGALAGRGELSIQLTQVILGGKTYPIVTDAWEHAGPDKKLETVNRAVGLGAVGAIIGAVAGGGAGAAIGGGVGAAAGIGSSAASGRGQVVVPSEATIAFHVVQPTPVTTVSQQEMQRLAYGVPHGGPPVGYYAPRRYPYYPPPPPPGYYAPVYPY